MLVSRLRFYDGPMPAEGLDQHVFEDERAPGGITGFEVELASEFRTRDPWGTHVRVCAVAETVPQFLHTLGAAPLAICLNA